MHSLEAKNGTVFHFNPDLSGEVIICRPAPESNSTATRMLPAIPLSAAPEISGADLLQFVAAYVQREKIALLEDAGVRELLGLPKEPRR